MLTDFGGRKGSSLRAGAQWLCGGEEGFEGFIAETDEGGDRPETVGEPLTAAGEKMLR